MPKYGKSKNPGAYEAWIRAKRQNRLKQRWVWDEIGRRGAFGIPDLDPVGHWEKIQ